MYLSKRQMAALRVALDVLDTALGAGYSDEALAPAHDEITLMLERATTNAHNRKMRELAVKPKRFKNWRDNNV